MKLVTFNIRCDFGQDGRNNFCYRKPLILKKLEQEKPDILCFQEVLPHVAVWLREKLTDYYVIGCARSEILEDEQVTVAFKKDKYNLMKMDTYWLSETPYVPASRYPEQSLCPRVCTEVVLQEMDSKKIFRVINTHLDHIGMLARKRGLEQIIKTLEEEKFFPDIPVVVTGDFNVEPDGEELKAIAEYPGFIDATARIGKTYHGYDSSADGEQIDYIYIKDGLVCESVEKWTEEENGVYLSDHYPVCAVLKFEA